MSAQYPGSGDGHGAEQDWADDSGFGFQHRRPSGEAERDQTAGAGGPARAGIEGGGAACVVEMFPPAPITTDQGRGDRIAQEMLACRSHIFVVESGWYRWADSYWTSDDDLATADSLAVRLARSRVLRDRNGAKQNPAALSDAAIRAALRRASMRGELRVRTDQLDRHPTLLATPSGTIDLATATVREADPDDLLTRCTPLPVDFDMATPGWHDYLRWVTGADEDMMSWLQRVAGMVICGQVLDHRLIVIYGPSRSGKSTFLSMLTRLLGSMAVALPAAMISSRRSMFANELEYRKADLRGARLAAAYESEEGGVLDEAAVKTLTSSDPITAREIRKQPISFAPSHTTLLATNERPNVISNDDAIWNRLVLVPFVHPRRPGDQDRLYVDRLIACEGPGILAWAAAGAAAYLADGLGTCAAVEAATAEHRAEQDLLGRFLAERCTVGAAMKVSNSALRCEWEDWCRQQGVRHPWSLLTLKKRLKDREIITGEPRTGTTRFVAGIGLQAGQEPY